MRSRKILVAMSMFGIVQSFYYSLQLPGKVAIHFGNGGLPDSWASNETSLIINVTLYVFLLFFILIIPVLFKIIPVRYINLPNKSYWLSDDRKSTTIDRISGLHNVYGSATIVFFIVLSHLSFKANMSRPVVLNEYMAWWLAGGFVVFTIGWSIVFYKRFSKI